MVLEPTVFEELYPEKLPVASSRMEMSEPLPISALPIIVASLAPFVPEMVLFPAVRRVRVLVELFNPGIATSARISAIDFWVSEMPKVIESNSGLQFSLVMQKATVIR